MNEKDDPILAAPNLMKDEATPMETNEAAAAVVENDLKSGSDEKDEKHIDYEERRISLLNNPNYGVILCFLDKFRGFIDLQEYPWHLLEENLLSDQENISRRLIDFHITLLKRISLGKGAQRDKFVQIITKFAYRFDFDDGEYLRTNGYSQAQIDVKLRILKNLLETQFDLNQTFKTALLEKQAFEVRSQPFGRDRSGAAYWLFMDAECFIRLFRETVDDDRNWTNIAKDKDEFENIIKLLISDHVVRKKFSDWKFAHDPFNSCESSNQFEERYLPHRINVKKEEEEIKVTSRSLVSSVSVKTEKPAVSSGKRTAIPPVVKNELPSDEESANSVEKTELRSRVASSEDTNTNDVTPEINNNQEDKQLKSPSKKSRGRRKSTNWSKKKRRTTSSTSKKDENVQECQTPSRGRKRKRLNDNEDSAQEAKKNDETSQDKEVTQISVNDDININEDLPIALRRSTRIRKAPTNEVTSATSSPVKSATQTPTKKKLANGKSKVSSQASAKVSSQSSKTNGRRKRGRRRGGKASANGCSSSSEEQPSEEEDEDYDSDDYLPDKNQIDELNDDDLLEEEDANDDDFVPRRSAKTVAKRRGQMIENNEELHSGSSACCTCSKTDRPEALLLCDDCDDAYHLECLKPVLLSVPDGDWYCPICEHKRLCNGLIEKFIQLLKEHEELEVKRSQCMSKRTNRLANVTLNLDRMVKRSSKKRRPNGIVYSDEENEDEDEQDQEDENKSEEEEEEEEDDDDDSVYGFKDDGSVEGIEKTKRCSSSSRGRKDDLSEQTERLGVRSCRRKPQNYRFDDYDKKMKEAMIEAGVNGDEIDKDDSDESDDEEATKASKKRSGTAKDEDFDVSGAKQDDEFAPDVNRSSESETEEDDYEDDDESSDDNWKSKRRTPKKKSNQKSTRNTRRSKNKSDDDDDDSLSDTELSNFQTADTTKSDAMNDSELNDPGNDDRRRSTRTTTQKNYANSDDDDDDDLLEDGRPPPRRMRYKKRRGSDESFIDDDDDYEKLARKRKIVKYGKSMSRSSITDHIKKLVDEEQPQEETAPAPTTQEEVQQNNEESSNQQKPAATKGYEEPQPSDDDDFPDEQEIFKANGLLKLQNNLAGPKSATFRPPFMAPMHSYQHAIVDPTARFAMIRPPVRPALNNGFPSNGHDNPGENQQPSDFNPVNGHTNSSL